MNRANEALLDKRLSFSPADKWARFERMYGVSLAHILSSR